MEFGSKMAGGGGEIELGNKIQVTRWNWGVKWLPGWGVKELNWRDSDVLARNSNSAGNLVFGQCWPSDGQRHQGPS